jgi:oxygen-independent coproporphyrinogen-3 oxidase
VFESHGVTRLSVGIQSFDDQVLATLGRPGRSRESDAALELLGRRWRGELSLDLLTGTPGQEWGSLQGDLDRAVGIAPHHVSLYSLSFDDPEHPLARRLDPDDQDRLWLRAYRRLEQRGYRNYEISNFARPGFECRHNLRYWYLEPYLGIGPGAASTLPGGDGGVLRLTHPRSLSGYLRGEPAAWGLETERVSPRELLLESLMMGLRLRDGVDSRRFAERFGADLVVLLPQTWRRLRSRRLLLPIGAVQLRGGARGGEPDVTAAALGDAQREAGRHALSFRGRMILDRLLEELQGEISELPEERLSVRWGE